MKSSCQLLAVPGESTSVVLGWEMHDIVPCFPRLTWHDGLNASWPKIREETVVSNITDCGIGTTHARVCLAILQAHFGCAKTLRYTHGSV